MHQFTMCKESIPNFAGIDGFIQKYKLDHCESAKRRIKDGRSSYKGEETEASLAVRVMDITTKMINAIDLLAIDVTDID